MTPFVTDPDFTLYQGDVLDVLADLPDESVHCCVTSPPYWGLRDYGADGQIGLEATSELYVARMVAVFAEVRRVLRSDGTCWLNIGDSYAGSAAMTTNEKALKGKQGTSRGTHGEPRVFALPSGTKPKDLVGIPWRLAFALQADGWYLRSDIIWSKPNPMPESVTDRPTKAHEYLFLLTKSARYFYDADAIKEPAAWERWGAQTPRKTGDAMSRGASYIKERSRQELLEMAGLRNRRSVWEIATEPYPDAHFATYPQALVEPCIKAGTSEHGCCPDCGAPWTRETDGASYYTGDDGVRTRKTNKVGNGHGGSGRGPKNNLGSSIARTTGWRPTCPCHVTDDPERPPWNPSPCVVLDPFLGSGTTALVARRHGRKSIGIELNPDYARLAATRLSQLSLLAEPAA